MSGRSTCRAAVLAFALALFAADARAQDPSRLAAATLLFDEGVRALDEGRLDEACAKLAKSQELAPSGGTLLALGECHERAGRVASAWVAFRGAAARANAAGKADAEADALEHAAKLEPNLPRLTIKITQNVELSRDGVAVSPSEVGVAMPIDPGKHEIRASAPGMKPWTQTIDVPAGAQTAVDVPPLVAEAKVETPPPVVEPDDTGSTQRTLGLVAGGVGAGALIAGSIFGLLAMSQNDSGEQQCVRKNCTQAGYDEINSASTKATFATIFFVAGGALLAGGAVLFFTAPKPHRAAFMDWSSATLRW